MLVNIRFVLENEKKKKDEEYERHSLDHKPD